jgi:hypothetical protein
LRNPGLRGSDLLKREDDELMGVLMGDLRLETEKMKFLVEKIRAFAVAGV